MVPAAYIQGEHQHPVTEPVRRQTIMSDRYSLEEMLEPGMRSMATVIILKKGFSGYQSVRDRIKMLAEFSMVHPTVFLKATHPIDTRNNNKKDR